MKDRVSIPFKKLIEACDFYGYDLHVLETKFPSIKKASEEHPASLTIKDVEKISRLTGYPFGYFFIEESPQKIEVIPDLRTPNSEFRTKISRQLQEQMDFCQARVDWFHNYAISEQFEKVACVNSVHSDCSPEKTAKFYREKLQIQSLLATLRKEKKNVYAYFRELRERIESIGILTEASGIAGNNTHHGFCVEEFRGFAITDDYAPLIFVNKKDVPEAQVFTLIHELAHIIRGESGISDANIGAENWCNRFAAEFLVPSEEMLTKVANLDEIDRLAKFYFVSRQVILLRAKRLNIIQPVLFDKLWEEINKKSHTRSQKQGGGNAIKNLGDRLSKRFSFAVLESARSGKTLFRDAFALLGANGSTFWKLAEHLEHNS